MFVKYTTFARSSWAEISVLKYLLKCLHCGSRKRLLGSITLASHPWQACLLHFTHALETDDIKIFIFQENIDAWEWPVNDPLFLELCLQSPVNYLSMWRMLMGGPGNLEIGSRVIMWPPWKEESRNACAPHLPFLSITAYLTVVGVPFTTLLRDKRGAGMGKVSSLAMW